MFSLFGGLPPEGSYSDADAPYIGTRVTEVLMSKLVNIIHRSVSQRSYAIESATWFNGGRTGIGASCDLIVQVRLPLVREDNPTVRVTGARMSAEVARHG